MENNAVPILGYRIYRRLKTNPDGWTKVGKVSADELEFRITDLTPNMRYIFGVSSKGKNGKSTIVETQSTTLKKQPVRPGAPTELDVAKRTSSSITLSWKPPRKSGYSRIHTYYLMMKDCEGNSAWTYLTTLQAFDRFMDYKVTGLKPNHQYRFRVNAENSAGLGPHAETITLETTDVEAGNPFNTNEFH
ncbi:twitchin-like [Mercenaria mercenaria]|uniref:twitchin-like n=1 Tax=Mercenaria mercenaria TaxID=6596 RepID=UPI00234FB1D7|nr:twitchin-like [Mercenaria mercenaria]